jgi:Ca2+-binding EF-hand superfamily protein
MFLASNLIYFPWIGAVAWRHSADKRRHSALFECLDIDSDGYISEAEFASGWSTLSSVDSLEQDGRQVTLVWREEDKTWIDESTGTPSKLTGKSSTEAEKPLEREEMRGTHLMKFLDPEGVQIKMRTTNLHNFPFNWLDKDNKGKITKEEFEAGYGLVQAFLAYEAGDGNWLCDLLRAKYLDEKKKPKANTNLVVELGHAVHSTPSPGIPAPARLPQSSVTPKCDPQTLKMGCSAVAAEGLRSAVGLDNDAVFANFMKNPEVMIECEILIAGLGGHPLGRIDDIDNYYSVKFGESGDWTEKEIIIDDEDGKAPVPDHVRKSAETKEYHGGSFEEADYDTGNKGKKLRDFHNDLASVLAGLFIYEVLILRLYTSSTYRLFNTPMRSLFTSDGQKLRHPLRFTIYVLTEGIKKLRAVEAKCNPEGFNKSQELWRGMKDMKLDEIFESVGGTEMAVMSTTSNKDVALKYASSESALVFKYKTVGLTRGVKIQFLSLYPKEVEYVYPPLTFLSVVGKPYPEATHYGNVTIVPVTPQMS